MTATTHLGDSFVPKSSFAVHRRFTLVDAFSPTLINLINDYPNLYLTIYISEK